jgi:hypothetical protein
VHQEQVEIVDVEVAQRLVEGAEGVVVRVEPVVELAVTKISPRSRPDARTASPTSFSLPYISAVSMWR